MEMKLGRMHPPIAKVVQQEYITQRQLNQKFQLVYRVWQEPIPPLLGHHLNPCVKIVQQVLLLLLLLFTVVASTFTLIFYLPTLQGHMGLKLVPFLWLVVQVVKQDCTIQRRANQKFQLVHRVWQERILPLLEHRLPTRVTCVTKASIHQRQGVNLRPFVWIVVPESMEQKRDLQTNLLVSNA